MQNPIQDRVSDFDAAEEIARHPIGAAQKNFRLPRLFEIEDPAMLEETVHDAAHRDVLADAFEARPQTTNPANNQVDLHPCLGRAIKRFNGAFIHERVHLGDDMCRQPFGGILRLAVN